MLHAASEHQAVMLQGSGDADADHQEIVSLNCDEPLMMSYGEKQLCEWACFVTLHTCVLKRFLF